jgi:hypothetical protein
MRQPQVMVSLQHLGSETCRLLQVVHGWLELPHPELPMASFKIKICVLRSKS